MGSSIDSTSFDWIVFEAGAIRSGFAATAPASVTVTISAEEMVRMNFKLLAAEVHRSICRCCNVNGSLI